MLNRWFSKKNNSSVFGLRFRWAKKVFLVLGRDQKSRNVMQPLTGPYVYGVNRRSENFLLLSDLLFAWGRCTRSRYKRVEIRVVLGCVFNFMICSKVIYTGLIKTETSKWNSEGYFHRACAICEKSHNGNNNKQGINNNRTTALERTAAKATSAAFLYCKFCFPDYLDVSTSIIDSLCSW